MSMQDYLKRYKSKDCTISNKKQKKRAADQGKHQGIKFVDDDRFLVPSCGSATENLEFDNDEEEDTPLLAFQNNKTDELRLLGKFSLSSWTKANDPAASLQADETNSPNSSDDELCGAQLCMLPGEVFAVMKSRQTMTTVETAGSCEKQNREKTITNTKEVAVTSKTTASFLGDDLSPPGRVRDGSDEADDLSPPRRERVGSDDDLSPPRKKSSSEFRRPDASPCSLSKSRHGESRCESLGDYSGRHAMPVFRKKQTKKHRDLEETEEQKKIRKQLEDKFRVWNKGVSQTKQREEKLQEMVRELEKPLARYHGDEDLEAHLKGQLHENDPMFEYIMRKKRKRHPELLEQCRRRVGPPNRFNIAPGIRWDGVDRSNGFESRLLAQKNLRSAERDEYYKWAAGSYE